MFYAAYFAFVGLYSPFLGPYLKDRGYDLHTIAIALGMMQFVRILGPFFWGWLSDHFGHHGRWIQFGSCAGFFFSLILFFDLESSTYLFLFIFLLNISVSGLIPMSDTYCMGVCKGNAGLYGKVRLFGSLGFVLAVLGFGAVAEFVGYVAYPHWMAVTLFFSFLFSLKFQYSRSETGRSLVELTQQQTRGMCFSIKPFSSSAMLAFWAASFFMLLAHGIFYAYYSLYLLDYHYAEFTIGGLWAFGVLCEVIFFACQTYFFQRFSLSAWLCFGYAACAIRFLITALFPSSLFAMVIAQSLHALTFAAHHTASISWLRIHTPSALQVRGQALYSTIAYGLGGSAGALLGRYIWESKGASMVFYGAAWAGMGALFFGIKLHRLKSISNL